MKTLTAIADIPSPPRAEFSQVAFLSILPDPLGAWGVYREFTPKRSDRETSVRGVRFTSDMISPGNSWLLLLQGEDPRIFRWGGDPWASCIIWRGHDWQQVLVHVASGEARILQHRLPFAGKNWIPVSGHASGDLLMIRSLQPLCVLRVDQKLHCTPLIMPASSAAISNQVGEYRGGAAAVAIGETIVGYGHRTRVNPDNHSPFKYTIDLCAQTCAIEELQQRGGFDGLPLIDPTSEVGVDRIVCACAAGHWWRDQVITHKLCQVGEGDD